MIPNTSERTDRHMTEARILIVDDEPIVREAICDWLVDAGYSVKTAGTGEEALEIVAQQDFRLVILDVRLPGKTGIRVLQEMKEMKPDIKAIIITAYASPDMRTEAMKLGAIHYLTKPIAPDQLEKLVQDALSD
jgi:DNA-binding NtrC family response regulator